MNTVQTIAEIILDIVSHDYAGKDDKAGLFRDDEYLIETGKINPDDIELFVHVTNTFLLELKDKHLFLFNATTSDPVHDTLARGDYTIQQLRGDTILLAFSDFFHVNAIEKIVRENDRALRETKNLIIDIRNNAGGTDTAWQPLLPFLFPPEGSVTVTEHVHLITPRNVENRNSEIRKYLLDFNDESVERFLHTYLKFEGNEGWVNFNLIQNPIAINGLSIPEKIVILANENTGSSSESLIHIARQSPKVKVFGRNTAGAWDYANVCLSEIPFHWRRIAISDLT